MLIVMMLHQNMGTLLFNYNLNHYLNYSLLNIVNNCDYFNMSNNFLDITLICILNFQDNIHQDMLNINQINYKIYMMYHILNMIIFLHKNQQDMYLNISFNNKLNIFLNIYHIYQFMNIIHIHLFYKHIINYLKYIILNILYNLLQMNKFNILQDNYYMFLILNFNNNLKDMNFNISYHI